MNILAYDYTGYGISEGEPSEEACYADIEAAFAYLVNVKKSPPSKIILYEHLLMSWQEFFYHMLTIPFLPVLDLLIRYGRSLGSGPTTYLAAKQSRLKQPVAGVILQSPLLSIYRVAFTFRFTMPGDMFCNLDLIEEVESPVTIIHGTRDEVVPFWHGEELFERCQQAWRYKPLWVTDAGHNNIEAYLRYVLTINVESAIL